MHVALVNNLYVPHFIGGAELSVQLLAETLVDDVERVSIITLGKKQESRILKGVHIHPILLANLYWPFGQEAAPIKKAGLHLIDIHNFIMERRFANKLDEIRPDIVHTNNLAGFSVSAWKACVKRGVPVVHTLRDFHLLCYRSNMFRGGESCGRQCLDCAALGTYRKWSSRQVDFVVGISKSILNEHLSRGFFKGCSNTVVYNGVEKSAISRSPDTDIIRFGFVGRLTPQKGIEWLITAFCDPEIMAKSSLEIIGEGIPNYVSHLKSIVPKGAAITFRGHLPAAEVMSDINILVTPSMWREPFGRAVAEAQAAGIPVIGNDIGGVGEIIVDGETGFLIKRDIPTSLIEAMLKFIRNSSLTKEMLPACISNAERFRVDVMASKYLEVYNEVINSN